MKRFRGDQNKRAKTMLWFIALLISVLVQVHIYSEELILETSFQLQKNGFQLCYDGRLRQPSYVVEKLTRDNITGNVNRSSYRFKEDDEVPMQIRSLLTDYKWSGYDRGHLVPAADLKCSEKGMRESFLLSNVCPQCPEFNRGYWSKLEKYVRRIVEKHDKVTVVTGLLFLPEIKEDGKSYVSYEVIGDNNVAVPTHLFKVILFSGVSEAYVIPNEKIDSNTPLHEFETAIEKIERASGLIFSLE